VLVLDSGGVTALAERSGRAVAVLRQLIKAGTWPPMVPSAVLVECLTANASRDARVHRLLKNCDVGETLSVSQARRAASLRHQAGRGSAVDAIVVAAAEPGGAVLTADHKDLSALAEYAESVAVVPV
jgi:hypothetical protein